MATLPGESWWYWALLAAGWIAFAAALCRARAMRRIGRGAAWRGGVLVMVGVLVGVAVGGIPTFLWHCWTGEPIQTPSVSELAWWSAAAVTGALGVWLAVWAVTGDPARGCRRCPRCWYDMNATPGLACTECGRSARTERGLFRTRRRWRWTAAAAGVGVLAAGMAAMPRLRDGTWPVYVPGIALAAAWPWLPDGSEVQEAAAWRFFSPEAPWDQGWRRRLVVRRAKDALRREERAPLLMYSIGMLQREDVDAETAERLVGLARHPSAAVRAQVLSLIGTLVPEPERVVPAAVANFADPSRHVVRGALNAIISVGWDSADGIAAPAELLALARAAPDASARGHAIRALGATRPTDEVMSLLLAAAVDPEPRVRAGALGAIARRDPDRKRAEEVLLRAREDADLDVRIAALTAMTRDGPYTDAVLAAIGRMSGEELSHHEGSGVAYELARAPVALQERLNVLGLMYANQAAGYSRIVIRSAVMSIAGEAGEAVRILTEQESAAEARGDARTGRWCEMAKSWIEETQRERAEDP